MLTMNTIELNCSRTRWYKTPPDNILRLTASLSPSHAAQLTMTPLEPWRTATPRQTQPLAAHEESRHDDHPPHVSLTSRPVRSQAQPPLPPPPERRVST